ncbi:MAG TPA: 4-alpha-glucanotransferase, partial [Gammaproteobacteria bacterium]
HRIPVVDSQETKRRLGRRFAWQMDVLINTSENDRAMGPEETLSSRRCAGVCLHITSLAGDYGIGELGANAFRFVDAIAEMGLRVWQFLPIGPVTYADSPYQTASTFAGNPMLIDLAALRDDGLLSNEDLAVLPQLPRDRVDFGALIPLKTELLYRAAQRFNDTADESRRSARAAFVAGNGSEWLDNYALFQVLREKHQRRAWPEWDPVYARRDPESLRAAAATSAAAIERVKTVQFLFFEQWWRLKSHAEKKGIALMGDLPIYAALDSADVWERQDLFALDDTGTPTEVGGVPPDYFSADGQRWGNPLYRWEKHAEDGYAWWTARLRHLTRMLDIIRLDHFRGFEAYWAVPGWAESAREGEWRPGPCAALFEALENSLGKLPIIAEDLGIITPEVETLRRQFQLPGMKVLQFMIGNFDFNLADVPSDCVCYTGTHDNDTTAGWFNGGPGDRRTAEDVAHNQRVVLGHTGGSPENVHADLIRLAFASQAKLAIIPMQDFLGLGSHARMNTPGTIENNWRWRMRAGALTLELIAWVRGMVAGSGRYCHDGAHDFYAGPILDAVAGEERQ